ncbi:uncharacterized protein LOC120001973 [Tripterygium wilfordii]|uniref:uncharacterized protein LOC120001973 n=1 Tax=Tripterygium wilfordii TaxID=458696 RepID=UPI0018F852F9|nr:uncharacterized protein LOC120001973 [Tripterygium wilfordii]
MDLTQTPTQDDSSIEVDQPGNQVKADAKILERKVMANRIYSQKNRIKQYNYNMQLEGEVRALQVELAVSHPRIKYTGLQNSLLRKENDSIKKTLYALSTELMWKEAQCEELKRERDSLKQFYMVNLQPLVLGMNQHQPPAGFSHPNMAHPGPAATEAVGTAEQMRNMNHLNQQEPHNFF